MRLQNTTGSYCEEKGQKMTPMLLIFDAECGYCRGFVRAVRRLDSRKQFYIIPYEAQEAQALLRTQFGDKYGFTLYLFERQEVSWGQEAARRIIESISLPRWMARLAFYLYPALVGLVSRLTRRMRPVCDPDCMELINSFPRQQLTKIENSAARELQRILSSS